MSIYTFGINNENFEERSREFICSYFSDKEWMEVDSETTDKDPHNGKIISLQLGDSENQFFIDCRKINILEFKELLEGKKLILQNSKFDYKMLKAAGIYIESIYDTMLAECVLYTGYEKWGYGLDKLIERYTGNIISKEERKGFTQQGDRPFTKAQIEYGATDVTYLHQIKEQQEKRIKELDLEYCVNLENNAVKALADIEFNGMILDKEDWLALNKKYLGKQTLISQELDSIVNTDDKLKAKYKPKYVQQDLFGEQPRDITINYASPSQIKGICSVLGYKVDSTAEKELKKLENKHAFFKSLLELREVNKVISTYGESFLNYISPITNRVHTSFWQVVTTGRVSSGSKDDNAPNLQNLPAKNDFRNCFKARKGFKWVSIDFSGQELNLMADRSKEQVFIDALNNNEDLHCKSATLLYGKTITKEDKVERTAAKTITFGLCYGMAAKKLSESLGITLEEAEELLKMYNKAFPTLMKWLENAGKNVKKEAKAVTEDICKRIRWFPKMEEAKILRKESKPNWREIFIIEGSVEREGKNFGIQGSGANITKESLVEVRELIKQYNKEHNEEVAYLICTVHDALDVEVREDLAKEFSKKMAQIMIDCGNKYLTKVKMGVDVSITDFWYK